MNLVIVGSAMRKWSEKVGNYEATAKIMAALRCSSSKAEKISSGRYQAGLDPDQQKALSELTKIPREALFSLRQQREQAS